MPRRQGEGPGHTRARRKAQEAAVRGLVADAVAEAHEAHAAAPCDLTGSARAFLNETALPAVRALNGARAPTLLPAMHRIVNAVQPGLISPDTALYGHWMEWRESNRSGRPLSMGDTLRLTGAGSAMSLRSSAPALLHALRTRYPGDAAPYLNQARATYPGGVSELDGALHLLRPPDEDLEVGEITVFVEGADEASARPRPTNPVYDGTRPTPPYAIVCEAFPRETTWCPALPPATHAPRGWANPDLFPPLSRTRGAHHRGQVLWQECPGTPLLLLVVATRGDPGRVLGITHTHLYGAAPVLAPPSRRPRRGTEYTPSCEHRRSPPLRGSTWCGSPRHHSTTPGGPGPRPRLGAMARRVGRVAPPPPLPMPMDCRRPPAVRGCRHNRPPTPSPPPPRKAPHGTAHGTALMHQEVVGRARLPPRMPTRITVMADSDGSPQRDDRHHRRSRSRSPASPEWTGETPAEREERRLAEAAVLVGPPPPAREPEPAEVTAPPAEAASPAAPPLEGAPDAQEAETAAPASHAAAPTAAPGTPPTRGVAPAQEPSASPRAAAAAEESEKGARGVATAAPAGCATASADHAATPSTPRKRGTVPARATGASPAAATAAKESEEGARGVATAAPVGRTTASAGHAATPSTPRKQGKSPARATGASPAAAAAAAVGRESAKYRAHANPTHTHTSPPKQFPHKPFPPGRGRHVRPPAPERAPPGVTLPQLQRQRDARRVIQEGGEGTQAELRASHGSAERWAGGDEGSAQERAQAAGQGTRGREQGRSSGGEQSAGSGRRDSGQGAGKGPGHGKGAQGHGQGAQVQGAGRGAVGERAGQGVGDGGQDPRHGQGAGKGPKGKGKGAAGPKGQA